MQIDRSDSGANSLECHEQLALPGDPERGALTPERISPFSAFRRRAFLQAREEEDTCMSYAFLQAQSPRKRCFLKQKLEKRVLCVCVECLIGK